MKLKIIRKALCTEYALPAFSILKETGKIRLVVDFRMLNKIIIKEYFLFLNVCDELQGITQSFISSQIDLNQGNHQIDIDKTSRKYTAFVLPTGHYKYLRVPFDLTDAPRLF